MSYVCIDMENLRFLFKGSFQYCDLRRSIECNVNTITTPATPDGLAHLTLYELQTLYRNTTSVPHIGYSYSHVLECCLMAMDSLADSTPTGTLWDMEAQSDYVQKNDPDGANSYIYMPNATLPITLTQITLMEGASAAPVPPDYVLKGAYTHTPAHQGTIAYIERGVPSVVIQSEPKPVKPAREPSGAPRGSVSQTIWAVADEMWTAAGNPVLKDVVMRLRKTIMDKLESDYGVKRTSASNELGNWQKARITV